MKLILCIFEKLSGLKINFHKSEIFYFGKANDEEHQYKHIRDVNLNHYMFDILRYPSILENSKL
jgi:hypothetical protein